MDFALGVPWNSDRALFKVKGWHALVNKIASVYESFLGSKAPARCVANEINATFAECGPFRTNATRSNFRFYTENDIAYYRHTDTLTPQAISVWYIGSGAQVGLQSISGLYGLSQLLDRRDSRDIRFKVWPHETSSVAHGEHVLAECYPAICPEPDDWDECQDEHERSAWRVLQFLTRHREANSLESLFTITPRLAGRYEGVPFERQVEFEGYILGLQ